MMRERSCRNWPPCFAAADVSIVNLESVVGDLPGEAAYPQKRFLLQTPPDALAALDELGLNVVALGNNHINDWQDLGLASTIRSLSAAGLAHTGAGANGTEARRPAVVDGYGSSVGVLSYTTVNGDFVNDSMAADRRQAARGDLTRRRMALHRKAFLLGRRRRCLRGAGGSVAGRCVAGVAGGDSSAWWV